jgi:1-pyrroline-5-carboxylate dehydrogenase
VRQAIAAAADAQKEWAKLVARGSRGRLPARGELLTTTWRATVNAATMLGQSKTAFQAEIDSASEMIDFWRFNPYFAQELYAEQPISTHGAWNCRRVSAA